RVVRVGHGPPSTRDGIGRVVPDDLVDDDAVLAQPRRREAPLAKTTTLARGGVDEQRRPTGHTRTVVPRRPGSGDLVQVLARAAAGRVVVVGGRQRQRRDLVVGEAGVLAPLVAPGPASVVQPA